MLTALFLTLIFAGLVLHYLLVERPRMRARQVEPTLPEPLPPVEAVRGIPEDAFLQPTLTWARLLQDGNLLLGLHPILISMVGSPYRLALIPEGWHIGKGRPLLRIEQGKRHLELRSPVTGRIVEVNPNACLERGWTRPRHGEDCWVYRVEPENVVWDLPTWLKGDEASAWMEERLRAFRAFLDEGAGEGAEDAGEGANEEIPVGVLAQLDPTAWGRFEERFLTPEGAPPGGKAAWRSRLNPFRRDRSR